jgi:hypothetical protein
MVCYDSAPVKETHAREATNLHCTNLYIFSRTFRKHTRYKILGMILVDTPRGKRSVVFRVYYFVYADCKFQAVKSVILLPKTVNSTPHNLQCLYSSTVMNSRAAYIRIIFLP